MVKTSYTPNRRDIVWAKSEETSGHEQKGRRPFVVLSPQKYNRRLGLAIVCPITSKVKGYSSEILVDLKKVKGAILINQLTTIDFINRKAEFIEKLDSETTKRISDYFIDVLGYSE